MELHELEYEWTVWYNVSGAKKGEYGEGMHEIGSVASLEAFWAMHDNLTPISELPQRVDYMVFKKGVKPKWEDPRNANGGSWQVFLDKDMPLDKIWTDLLVEIVGEQLDEAPSAQICGVVCAPRSQKCRVDIWTSNCEDAAALPPIGSKLRQVLLDNDVRADILVKYYKHGQREARHEA